MASRLHDFEAIRLINVDRTHGVISLKDERFDDERAVLTQLGSRSI